MSFALMARVGPLLTRHPRLLRGALSSYGTIRGCRVRFLDQSGISVSRRDVTILIRADMAPYVRDLVDDFSSYSNAVVSDERGANGAVTLDFRSEARWSVRGWDLSEVLLPGLPEPIETLEQYADLTTMSEGMSVLDLGAYAGLSSMFFQEIVGPTGSVVALEADPRNASCARRNLQYYHEARGYSPELIEQAVWSHTGDIEFVAEASLGSAAAPLLTRASSRAITVRCTTLSDLCRARGIDHVDIIKADIEGSEFAAFSDPGFFAKHHPRVVFEPALNSLPETQVGPLKELMESYGYSVVLHNQAGSRLPLIVCS